MKSFKKLLSIILAVIMVFSTFSMCITVNAANVSTSDTEPIKIEVTTNKSSYTAIGTAKISVKVTNIGDTALENVSAESLCENLAPINKDSRLTAETDKLNKGESLSFSFDTTVKTSFNGLSFFQKFGLFFKRLFKTKIAVKDNGFDNGREVETYTSTIKFGKFDVPNTVKVWYGKAKGNTQTKQLQEMIVEYFDVQKDVNTINSKYTDNRGYIKESDADKVYNEVAAYAQKMFEMKRIKKYNLSKDTHSVYMELNNGIGFGFQPMIAGYDSADVLTFQPCLNTYSVNDISQEYMTEHVDGAAIQIKERIKNFQFTKNLDNQDVTIDAIKKSLTNNQFIIWHGHGYYTPETHSALMTTIRLDEDDFLWDPIYYLKNIGYTDDYLTKRIIIVNGYIFVTSKFIEKYSGDLENSFIYLGACSSAKDEVLIDSFLSKGASTVIGNTDVIHTYYNLDMIYDVCSTMTQFSSDTNKCFTVSEALNIAKKENGRKCCKNESHESNCEVKAFGNLNYRFLEPYDIATSEDNGYIVGKVCDENGNPIADATVNMYGLYLDLDDAIPISSTKTDANGNFTISGQGNLVATLQFVKNGYETKVVKDVKITANDTTNLNTVTLLSKQSETYKIKELLLSGYWENKINSQQYFKFTEDGQIQQYDKDGEDFSPKLMPSVSYQYQIKDNKVSVSWNNGTEIGFNTLEYVKRTDPKIQNSVKNQCLTDYPNAEYFLFETNYDGRYENALYFVLCDENGEYGTLTDSGKCGESLTWSYYEDTETLVIIGEGNMNDYSYYNTDNIPWYQYRETIKKIELSPRLTSIGGAVFKDFSRLETISIPPSVTTIGGYAFENACNLSEIILSEGLNYISDYAFSNCNKLKEISIPNTVKSLGWYTFINCSSIERLIIPEGIKYLGNYTFKNCEKLESIILPENLITIGEHTFSGCSNLKSISIPNNVNAIGAYAFENSGLNSIKLSDSITMISPHTFDGCPLNNLIIPNGVKRIGSGAFFGCGIESITIPDSVTQIDYYAFRDCKHLITVTIPDSVTIIDYAAFLDCANLTNIKLSSKINVISDYLFQGCINLTNIVIPNGVERIGDYSFRRCGKLTSIIIPNSVTSIGDSAFRECYQLTNITIPKNVKSIEDSTFRSCNSLTSIIIPISIENINDYAFYYCFLLKDIYYYGTETQWNNISVGVQNGQLDKANIHFNYNG